MWANISICSYSDFNLAYVAEFQYKTGYAKKKPKKTVGMDCDKTSEKRKRKSVVLGINVYLNKFNIKF